MTFRTALRRLRANVSNFGWGARFALTVRIPRDAFTVPYPAPSPELSAHLEGYESTGDLGIGKKFGDGNGARLRLSERIGKDGVVETYATALVGRVRQIDEDWWDVADSVEKSEDCDDWAWLREYADNVTAQGRWINENVDAANWHSGSMNDAWAMARACCSATYNSRDTIGGTDVWHTTFVVKTYYKKDVPLLAKSVARFVRAAKRNGIDARYF